jgi:hypothetical protein
MWVQLAILIISSLIQYALAPKPKAPTPQKATTPTVQEGTNIRRIYGTVWVDDSMVLAFKQTRTTPIKAKGK